MKFFFSLILVLGFVLQVDAQFSSATIGIDGLTCSMCSNSVEKMIRKLDFVEKVEMDLNDNIAKVTFREGKKVNIRELADKVRDAGFSTRYVHAVFNFDNTQVGENTTYNFEGASYVFLNTPNNVLNGKTTLLFIGKDFMSKNELSKWNQTIKLYNQKHSDKPKNAYYVSI